jgi:microcystin-dependent protein
MSGQFKLSNGVASTPAIAFNSSQGTGLFKTTNGLGVAVNGAQVAEFTSNGMARIVGELIFWTRLSAPPGWLLPCGQVLNRTDYPSLWTVAQSEIALGNTFYNNGNGTTTFGIADLRGRVIAATDTMGSGDAGRLSTGALSAVRSTLGAAAGEPSHTLGASEIPVITSGLSISATVDQTGIVRYPGGLFAGGVTVNGSGGGTTFNSGAPSLITPTITISGSATSNNAGGLTHNNMQPTMLCYYALYAGA